MMLQLDDLNATQRESSRGLALIISPATLGIQLQYMDTMQFGCVIAGYWMDWLEVKWLVCV